MSRNEANAEGKAFIPGTEHLEGFCKPSPSASSRGFLALIFLPVSDLSGNCLL
jgi:hypothetical protein